MEQNDQDQNDNKVCVDTCINRSKSFYTAGKDGGLKQFSYDDQKLMNDFGQPFNCMVNVIMKTPDEKYLYIGCDNGWLYQWSIEESKIAKDFGRAHEGQLDSSYGN